MLVQNRFVLLLMSGVLLVLPSQTRAQSAPEAQTEVTVSLKLNKAPAITPEGFQARGTATWYGAGKVEPALFDLSSAGATTLKLRPGRWVLQAEAAGYWGGSQQLELTEAPATARLDLWPAGALEGGFLHEGNLQPPAEMALFFRHAPGDPASEDPPPAKVICPVQRQTWKCVVPAGVMDLRFQAAGFVPRYLWGIRVAPGQTVQPGRLDLRQGSAVLGWIVTSDRTPLGKETKVTLRPRIGGAVRNPEERQRLESLRFDADVNSRGFFQIDGIPPGAYLLEARHGKFAPAIVSVRVAPGEVIEIANPPLLLDYPKVVEVFVEPPAGPMGQRWSLKLQQIDRDSSVVSTVAEEAVATDGSWKKAGISPGRYLLKIASQADTWWVGEVLVDENPAPVQVRIETVTVKGTVRLGKQPLAASLRFGGRFGAVRIETRSDEKGRFETLLPKVGEWAVQVTAADPAVEREIPKVKIAPKPGTDIAEVDLRLPNTLLRGRVEVEGGGPAPEALVSAMSNGSQRESRVQVRADKEGRFELRGLLPGPTLLEADAGDGLIADPVSTDIREDEDDLSVILYARPQMRVTGTVLSSAGPVAGARIKAAPASSSYLGIRTVATDAQGRFEVTLPPKTREVLLTVAAPGFAFRILRLPVPENKDLTLGVEQVAGTLILEPEQPVDFADPDGPMIYLLRGGAVEPLPTLLAWARMAGAHQEEGRSVIPALEPGDYQVCLALPTERLGLDFGITPSDRCSSGTLASNGELTLKVPGLKDR